MFTLDIGGEGRHHEAWNLNPSPVKPFGLEKGSPIPRRIAGRADAIPVTDQSVDRIIMERTPLRRKDVEEFLRVIVSGGEIILRHFYGSGGHPHAPARGLICGQVTSRQVRIGGQWVEETIFSSVSRVE